MLLQIGLNEVGKKAVGVLKDKLVAPPVLALPQLAGQYTIDTDACDTQIGCVILQEQEDKVSNPTRYWSRSLYETERHYDRTHKKCLAVIWAVLLLGPYLDGSHFVVRTNLQALRLILNLKNLQDTWPGRCYGQWNLTSNSSIIQENITKLLTLRHDCERRHYHRAVQI